MTLAIQKPTNFPMKAEENSIASTGARAVAVAPFLFIGIISIILGMVLFLQFSADERDFNARMESIRAGKISPKYLTVIEKYVEASRHDYPHVVCRDSHSQKVDLLSTRAFYDSVVLGSPVTAYYFPDGYFVPQSQGGQAGIAKWIFLASGLSMGGLIAALGLFRFKRLSANPDRVAALFKTRIEMPRRPQ